MAILYVRTWIHWIQAQLAVPALPQCQARLMIERDGWSKMNTTME